MMKALLQASVESFLQTGVQVVESLSSGGPPPRAMSRQQLSFDIDWFMCLPMYMHNGLVSKRLIYWVSEWDCEYEPIHRHANEEWFAGFYPLYHSRHRFVNITLSCDVATQIFCNWDCWTHKIYAKYLRHRLDSGKMLVHSKTLESCKYRNDNLQATLSWLFPQKLFLLKSAAGTISTITNRCLRFRNFIAPRCQEQKK